jgi:hypothetical protein
MGKKRILVSYGVDIDAVAGWLGSYGGEDSANDISRGILIHYKICAHAKLYNTTNLTSMQVSSPAT